MKNILIFTTCALLAAFQLRAQNEYVPLECKGKIPAEILTSSHSKYQEATKNIVPNSANRNELNAQKQFELAANFHIDKLLRGGRVLFNDEVSTYLSDVTKILLQSQPDREQLTARVYALRSSAVNAFATDRGEVFVTLGLIAQLENEAQLAYIIAHELVHVEKKHSVQLILEAAKLQKKQRRNVLSRVNTDEKLLALASYSKENEYEADRRGLERILQSPYSTATLPVVYDVLKYSYLPFDDLPFDRKLLESESYRLPDSRWLESVKPIEGEDEEEDDERHTHPNLKSRREAMLATLNMHTDGGEKSNYVVSAERFERIRSLARNELPLLYLHDDQHAAAIYNAGLLLRERPDDPELKKCIAKALYLFAKLKNSSDYNYEGDYKDVEGESQQLHYLLEEMSPKETTVLALQYAWNLRKTMTEDSELRVITEDIFFEYARNYKDFSDFKKQLPSIDAPRPDTTVTETKPSSKYDRIRERLPSAPQSRQPHDEYWQYAFAGEWEEESLVQLRQSASLQVKDWEKSNIHYNSVQGRKEYKRLQKKGLSLNIPKIAIVNPFFLVLDERKDEAVQYLHTEQGEEHFRDLIKEVADASGIEAILIDVHNLKEDETDVFNDIRYLNEWFSEQTSHFDLTLTPGNQQARIDSIARKYGTDYFLWTGAISMRQKHTALDWIKIPASLIGFPPFAPILLYNAVTPKYEMLHYAILFDVRTGRRQVLKFDTARQRASDFLLKAHLYDAFLQIKREK
jgi:beta-barrel assembly-enhancing protease